MVEFHHIELGTDHYISDDMIESYKNNSYYKWYLEVMRDLPKAVVMLKRRGRNNFSSVVLRKALKFQMTDAVLMIAKEFPKHLLFSKKYADVEYYSNLIAKHSEIQQAETKVISYSDQINFLFFRKRHNLNIEIEPIRFEILDEHIISLLKN